jgi:20S proteasome alpha/beta subunit
MVRLSLSLVTKADSPAQSNPMELNGGSVVAMIGKDCVAIASDLRLGQQAVGLASNFEKVRTRAKRGGDEEAFPSGARRK